MYTRFASSYLSQICPVQAKGRPFDPSFIFRQALNYLLLEAKKIALSLSTPCQLTFSLLTGKFVLPNLASNTHRKNKLHLPDKISLCSFSVSATN